MERLPDNGNNDITEAVWFVTFSDGSCVKQIATSEMGAIISAEEEFGGTAVAASLNYPGRRS
jgi:hypothetical protein